MDGEPDTPVMQPPGRLFNIIEWSRMASRHQAELAMRFWLARLQVLHRRHAELRFKNTPQVAITDAEPTGQPRNDA